MSGGGARVDGCRMSKNNNFENAVLKRSTDLEDLDQCESSWMYGFMFSMFHVGVIPAKMLIL